jgi:hypothetical protein
MWAAWAAVGVVILGCFSLSDHTGGKRFLKTFNTSRCPSQGPASQALNAALGQNLPTTFKACVSRANTALLRLDAATTAPQAKCCPLNSTLMTLVV